MPPRNVAPEKFRIGTALATLIAESGVSRQALALKVKKSKNTIDRWCAGYMLCSRDDVALVEQALGERPGIVASIAGYSEEATDLRSLIQRWPSLGDAQRRILLVLLDELETDTQESRSPARKMDVKQRRSRRSC